MMGIQAGIQAGHAYQKCFLRNKDCPIMLAHAETYEVWKILNAGEQPNMIETRMRIQELGRQFEITIPFASFRESESAMNNTLTSICLILPYLQEAHDKTSKRLYKFTEEVYPLLPKAPAR